MQEIRYAVIALQVLLFVLLLYRRWHRTFPFFTIAVALASIKNYLYNPYDLLMWLQLIETLFRIGFAMEILLLLSPVYEWWRGIALAGIFIAASASPITFFSYPTQTNLIYPAFWRAANLSFSFIALSLFFALLSDWRFHASNLVLRLHALISLLYFTEQTILNFRLGYKWTFLRNLHTFLRLFFWSMWLALFYFYTPLYRSVKLTNPNFFSSTFDIIAAFLETWRNYWRSRSSQKSLLRYQRK